MVSKTLKTQSLEGHRRANRGGSLVSSPPYGSFSIVLYHVEPLVKVSFNTRIFSTELG